MENYLSEMNSMKGKIEEIFETNEKVEELIKKRNVQRKAEIQQSNKIQELVGSFKNLEDRFCESNQEFIKLEKTVEKLAMQVEKATSVISSYKGNVKIRQRKHYSKEVPLEKSVDIKSNSYPPTLFIGKEDHHSSEQGARNRPGQLSLEEAERYKRGMRSESSVLQTQDHTSSRYCASLNNIPYPVKTYPSASPTLSHLSQSNARSEQTTDRSTLSHVHKDGKSFKRLKTEISVDNRIMYAKGNSIQNLRRKEDSETVIKETYIPNIPESKAVSPHGQDDHDRVIQSLNENVERQCKEVLEKQNLGVTGFDTELFKSGMQEVVKLLDEEREILQHIDSQSPVELIKEDTLLQEHLRKLDSLAQTERMKGSVSYTPRGVGPDTVLCLDTSSSMEGTAFREMICTALKFVTGIQEVSLALGIEENIGVATFGRESTVLLHLTNNYARVRDVILSVTPCGPSPMLSGIYMALAACNGNSKQVTMSGIPVGARIILISDGKGTPDHWHLREDNIDTTNPKPNSLVMTGLVGAGSMVKSMGHTIYCVPVGDNYIKTLERLSKVSGGRVYYKEEIHRLIKMAQNQASAAESAASCKDLEKDEDAEPFLKALCGIDSSKTKSDPDSEDTLFLALKYFKRMKDMHIIPDDPDPEISMREINPYMPYIGSRVRRGLDWSWGNQDRHGTGTVIGHDTASMVWVEWDYGHRNVYHYTPSIKDLKVVQENRELKQGEDIAVGCKVKRGKNWHFGDQDGGQGSIGVVIKVARQKVVHVRWPNKSIANYRFGAEGYHDVQLVDQRAPNPISSSSRLPPKTEFIIKKGTRKTLSVEEMNKRNQSK